MARTPYTGGPLDPGAPENVAMDAARAASPGRQDSHGSHAASNWIAAVVSLTALAFSGYSLWETSLKAAELSVFVPPVVHFSQPYNNTNFEVIEVPVTILNDGAKPGTVVSMNLAVTDPRKGLTKNFYAANLGRWSMEQTRALAYKPFAPISISGNSSRSETILFYTRGEEQKPNELIREKGNYNFELSLVVAESQQRGWSDKLWPTQAPKVSFVRELKMYDARAFEQGSLALYAPDWSAASNASGN